MKKMRLILFTLLCTIVTLFNVNNVKADSIDSIDMNIVLDENGTAIVTETWKANVHNGTEGYHPYYNLGMSNITVLKSVKSNFP